MRGNERQTICFSETGIGAPTDNVERVALTDGVKLVTKKIEVQPPKRTSYTTDRLRVVDRFKVKHENLYQLVVTAIFQKIGPTQKTVARGYSKLTHARYTTPPRYGTRYYYQKQAEALRHAKAQVMSRHAGTWGEWVLQEITDEFWLRH